MTKDWTDLPLEERAASAAQSPAPQKPVLTTPKKSYRWIGWFVFAFIVFGSRAYERQVHIDKLDKMRAITNAHDARVATFDKSILADKRFERPEVRAAWRSYTALVSNEMNRTEKELRKANDGELPPVNTTDFNAGQKVCKDTFAFLDTLDKAEFVPGASDSPVVKDGELKEQFKRQMATLAADSKALDIAEKAANDGYAKQQSEGRQ
jgi:hypothetical protein